MDASTHQAPVARPPSRPTVLYDARCRICTASVERLRARDREGRIDFLSLHEPEVAARFPEIRREDVLEAMHVVLPTGEVLRGALSLRAIFALLPRLRWLALLWYLPGFSFAADRGYRWVARNRYRWNRQACDGGTCSVHHRP